MTKENNGKTFAQIPTPPPTLKEVERLCKVASGEYDSEKAIKEGKSVTGSKILRGH